MQFEAVIEKCMKNPMAIDPADRIVTWRCCQCHGSDIHGGIKQTSKTKGAAGRCYWCGFNVDVYFGASKKLADL